MRLTPEIIAAMHALALEQRRDLGVRAPWHVGDITWALRQHEGREDAWTIRVWKDGDRTVAWSWLKADCVVEAPDGRFAAYCLLWPDDENQVGELEPVGVREEFRRRGLGAAVCTFALRRWHEEGGRAAIVYCENDAACGLYESIGFRRHTAVVGYSR